MSNRSPLARAIRLVIGGAAGLTTALCAPLAVAQNEQEEVVVVGSRIGVGSNFESPSPLVTVDREAIAASGYTNLQQLLVKLPSSGNGTFSTRGNNQDSTANGAAGISLRGLGADATLVLVNGRRVAISSFAENITTNFVDINAIPVSAIERIEVLKDGASAVYGSDAVAGVINIVLRKDFDGFETTATYGQADGLDETTASMIWGTSGEAGNVTIMFDYYKSSRLDLTERSPLGPNQTAQGGEDQRSSRGFPGSFVVNGVDTRDPGCPTDRIAGANCLFDYGPYNLLSPEAERSGLVVNATRNFAGAELFAELAVQHNRGEAQGAPTPLDGGAGLTVPITHPNNPFPTAIGTIGIRRFRTVDAGARVWNIETDNLRALLGLRGSFGDWDWEVAGQRGRSESTQTGSRNQGWVRTDFLQQQINSGAYNPFGGFVNSQDVIDQITTSLIRQGESDLTAFDATLTGSPFEMPAGAVRMAVGAEYREESVSDSPDDQFQRGLIFGTESVSAAASRDITSFFVEFSVPLLESLEMQVAGRYDDYSDFGDTTNPKVALRWAVTDEFALRGSWSEGFRAPSLAQIGLGPSQESQFFRDTLYCTQEGTVPCPLLDYLVVFSANPDLSAEESESMNFGVLWQPSDAFSIALDYWDITQSNKIDEEPFGFIYQEECGNQASTICLRLPPVGADTLGELQSVAATFNNIGEQSVTGVDLEVNYTREVRSATVSLGLNYTHMLDFERVEVDAIDGVTLNTRELTGEYEYPEDRAVFTSNWTIGDWGISTALNYVGSFEDLPDINGDLILDYDENDTRKVDSWMTTNVQVSYNGIKNTVLALGVDNLFDEEVPFAVGDFDSDVYGFVQSQHDPRGQFIYGRMTYAF